MKRGVLLYLFIVPVLIILDLKDLFVCFCQIASERSSKEADILNTRFQKLQQDFEAQLIACDSLNSENQNKALELKVCLLLCYGLFYIYIYILCNIYNFCNCSVYNIYFSS